MSEFNAGNVEPERDSRLTRWQVQIFATLWGGYASYYLCRMNFSVAQPLIMAEFGWKEDAIGLIPTVYALTYAIGQFVNGQLGEKFGARRMMTAAMTLAVVANVLFPLATSLPMMMLLWGINGYAQSAGWSLVVKTLTNWTTTRNRGLLVGLISTCYQVGNVLAWLLAGTLAGTYGWRVAFFVPSAILSAMTLALWFFLRDDPRLAGFGRVRDDIEDTPAKATVEESIAAEKLPFLETMRLVLSNKVLWVLALGYFCMNAVRYSFMNWAVTYMADYHGQNIKQSAFKAVALPLIGAVGAVLAGWLSDKLFNKRRAPLCAIMLFGLALVCIGFVLVPRGETLIATAMLGLAGFLVYGPDMLMSGAATADVHPKAAAAATGFTMAMGNFGAMISGAGIGWLIKRTRLDEASITAALPDWAAPYFSEWILVFCLLAFLAILSAVLMTTIWNARPKGAK